MKLIASSEILHLHRVRDRILPAAPGIVISRVAAPAHRPCLGRRSLPFQALGHPDRRRVTAHGGEASDSEVSSGETEEEEEEEEDGEGAGLWTFED